MKRALVIGAGLLAVVAAALVYWQWPRPAPRAVDLLPDTTLLYLEAPDVARARAELRQTAAYALWQEPEVQAFLAKPRRALHDALGRSATTEENTLARLRDALQGEVFVAVTSVTAIPNLQAGIVVGADVKGKLLETRIALANLERKFRKFNPEADIADKRYLGIRYTVWQKNPHLVVCYGLMNSLVVVTLGEDTMRDTITRFTHRLRAPTPNLAASAKFGAVLRQMPPGHEFVAYLNVEQIMALFGPFLALAPQGSGLLQKLGDLQAAGASATFAGPAVQEVHCTTYAPNSRTPAAATPRQTLALTTPQTSLYRVQSADLAGLGDQVMQALAQSGQPKLSASVAQFQKALSTRGVRIREDLLASLGPETAVIGQWRAGAQFPDVALVAAVNNAAKTAAALDPVMQALKDAAVGDDEHNPWDAMPQRGYTLHTVRIGSGRIAPTYVATGQYFILATTPDYARELLSQALDAKPNLASSGDYQHAMTPLPAHAASYTYCDLRVLYPPLQAAARSGLIEAGGSEFVDAEKFPHPETVTRHLFPFVAATTGDSSSQTSTSYSPFGTPVGLVAGALGAYAASRAFTFTPEPAPGPVAPRPSSGTTARPRPRENQAVPSHSPSPE